jgi:hypothetical protein
VAVSPVALPSAGQRIPAAVERARRRPDAAGPVRATRRMRGENRCAATSFGPSYLRRKNLTSQVIGLHRA